jgi:hypothetical protein
VGQQQFTRQWLEQRKQATDDRGVAAARHRRGSNYSMLSNIHTLPAGSLPYSTSLPTIV